MKLYLATDRALAVLTVRGDHCRNDLQLAGRQPQCIAVDPLRPELVYCGTFMDGVWRSNDAGRNWRAAGEGLTCSKVLSVAVSRLERVHGHGVVYAGTEPSQVFRSEDAGETWRQCGGLTALPSASEWSFPPRPETHHVRWIQPDPHAEGRIFAAIEAGALVLSSDGGKTWRDRTPDGPIDTHQMAVHREDPGRLYSAAGDGYFESRDAGETWQRHEDGLRHTYVWSVAVDAGNPENRIVSAAASPRHSHDEGSAASRIYRRTAESPWREIRDGLPASSGRRTASLASHPIEPGIFFAVWENDVFRSSDAGLTWRRLEVPWPEDHEVEEPNTLVAAAAD